MTTTPTAPHPMLKVAPDVAEALAAGAPVVALESTIISHGMPYPQNVAMAREVEQIVRDGGAVPATIAVLDGRPTIGLDDAELELLGTDGGIRKVSVRDLPHVVATERARGHDGGEHDAPRRAGRHPVVRHRRPRRRAPRRRAARWTSRPTSPSSPAPRWPSSPPG